MRSLNITVTANFVTPEGFKKAKERFNFHFVDQVKL